MKPISLFAKLKNRLQGTVLAIGIGNTDYCDDGSGINLVKRLQPNNSLKTMLVYDSPEFHLEEIISKTPDVIMFVDSTDLGSPPGSATIIEKFQLCEKRASTHRVPLSVIAKYISERTYADIFLLGIQPKS